MFVVLVLTLTQYIQFQSFLCKQRLQKTTARDGDSPAFFVVSVNGSYTSLGGAEPADIGSPRLCAVCHIADAKICSDELFLTRLMLVTPATCMSKLISKAV